MVEAPDGDDWIPMSEAQPDSDEVALLAAYIIPSQTAIENGAKPYWTYGIGTRIYDGVYSGILSCRPSHWKKLAPPKRGIEGLREQNQAEQK